MLSVEDKRQFAVSLAVDLVKPKAEQAFSADEIVGYFDKVFDAIYEKLSEKAIDRREKKDRRQI